MIESIIIISIGMSKYNLRVLKSIGRNICIIKI